MKRDTSHHKPVKRPPLPGSPPCRAVGCRWAAQFRIRPGDSASVVVELCEVHFGQWPDVCLTSSPAETPAQHVEDPMRSICQVPGCEKKHVARGRCTTHYSRAERGGYMDQDPAGDDTRHADLQAAKAADVERTFVVKVPSSPAASLAQPGAYVDDAPVPDPRDEEIARLRAWREAAVEMAKDVKERCTILDDAIQTFDHSFTQEVQVVLAGLVSEYAREIVGLAEQISELNGRRCAP